MSPLLQTEDNTGIHMRYGYTTLQTTVQMIMGYCLSIETSVYNDRIIYNHHQN